MLGDHNDILREVISEKNLRRAFSFAVYDREHNDSFFDPFELLYIKENRDRIVGESLEDLEDPSKYQTRPAFSYYMPKNDLCFRRMIYLPFKDLLPRYAMVSVIADYTNSGLYSRSFANRRATGVTASIMLLSSYAEVSWPAFCGWQRKEARSHKVLLKTDISAFYDSVSHEYLVDEIAKALGISSASPILEYLRNLLRTHVISYSTDRSRTASGQELRQGLCTGSAVEGYLANLHLKETDTIMERYCQRKGLSYGRYNDDTRIFADNMEAAKEAALLLQQCLLTKGLNLNASKTKFAGNPTDIEKLISNTYEYIDYGGDEEENSAALLEGAIDQPFEHVEEFGVGTPPKDESDAKKFCRFVHKRIALPDRSASIASELRNILTNFPGSTKYACWLLAETACRPLCTDRARRSAASEITETIKSPGIASYAKYRLLHHLTKMRRDGRRFIEYLETNQRSTLDLIVPKLIEEPAFELSIGALYYMFVQGYSRAELERVLQEHAPKPIALPLQNILLSVPEQITSITIQPASEEHEEPDAVPEYF